MRINKLEHRELYLDPAKPTHTPGICLTCKEIYEDACPNCGNLGKYSGKVIWCHCTGWIE